MFSKIWTKPSTKSCSEPMERLKAALQDCDAVVIGAGAGLSTAAGFTYTGERFEQHFSDFAQKYGIQDMYSGGFYPFPTQEEFWAYWSRYIYINRYQDAPTTPLWRMWAGTPPPSDMRSSSAPAQVSGCCFWSLAWGATPRSLSSIPSGR